MNRPAAARFTAYVAVVVVGTLGMWRVETTADNAQQALDELEADRHTARVAACEKDDRTNAIVRQIGKDVGITSGVTGGEALIQAAGEDSDNAETIAAYRAGLTKLLDPSPGSSTPCPATAGTPRPAAASKSHSTRAGDVLSTHRCARSQIVAPNPP